MVIKHKISKVESKNNLEKFRLEKIQELRRNSEKINKTVKNIVSKTIFKGERYKLNQGNNVFLVFFDNSKSKCYITDSNGKRIGEFEIELNPNLIGNAKHYFSSYLWRELLIPGKGIGSVLLKKFEKIILEKEKKDVLVSGDSRSLSALNFFLANGYKIMNYKKVKERVMRSINEKLSEKELSNDVSNKLRELRAELEKANTHDDLNRFFRECLNSVFSIEKKWDKRAFNNALLPEKIYFSKKLVKQNPA